MLPLLFILFRLRNEENPVALSQPRSCALEAGFAYISATLSPHCARKDEAPTVTASRDIGDGGNISSACRRLPSFILQGLRAIMPPLAYAENERTLCFHGPLMYEAKILKAEFWEKGKTKSGQVGPHYYVHYKGWKQTWDEWVPEDRLCKFNEEGIRKQKALVEAQRARDAAEREQAKIAEENARRAAAGGAGPGAKVLPGPSTARGQKRGRDGDWAEDEYMKRPEIKISIPDNLKLQLVDDWEAITKNQQLVPLPRNPSVDTILDEWMIYLQNEDEDKKRIAAEVAAGLGLYFNKALGNNLLYRFERGQYQEQYKKLQETDKQMSSIYGGEHLLRLFVNLPELLVHTTLDPESMGVLKENMVQFLQWMDLNRKVLFVPEYIGTSSGYQNNNRG